VDLDCVLFLYKAVWQVGQLMGCACACGCPPEGLRIDDNSDDTAVKKYFWSFVSCAAPTHCWKGAPLSADVAVRSTLNHCTLHLMEMITAHSSFLSLFLSHLLYCDASKVE